MRRLFPLLLLCALPAGHAAGQEGPAGPYPTVRGPGTAAPLAPSAAKRYDPFRSRAFGRSGAAAAKVHLGAKPVPPATPIPTGPNADALPALQALVDAAQKTTDADMTSAWTVTVPQAVQPYYLSGPLYLDGRNVTLAGAGAGSRLAAGYGGYGGPAVVLGVTRLQRLGINPASYRVPSVLGGGRLAISTKGTAVLTVTAHPLQLGGNPTQGSLVPDYWQSPAYVFEFIAGPSAGATWGATVPLFGLSPAAGGSWGFYSGTDMTSISLFVRRASQAPGQWDTFTIPTPGPWPHAVTAQWDSATATVTAWVDGVKQPVTKTSNGGPAWAPGERMTPGTGDIPFRFGGEAALPIPVDVHGFLVSVGKKYDPAKPTEARLDGTPMPIGINRYAERPVTGPVSCVACLPMGDTPATHVPVWCSSGSGVGFWIPVKLRPPSSKLALRDLTISTYVQQAVAVGASFGVDLTNITVPAQSLQGVGSIPVFCTYPVRMQNCTIGGLDCAYYGWEQLLTARDTVVSLTGKDGLRTSGGSFLWDGVLMTFSQPYTETFFRQYGNGYGGSFAAKNVLIDNESGTPGVAVIEVDQSPYVPNKVIVDNVNVSTLNAPAALVHLVGGRTDANGNLFPVGSATITNLQCFAGVGAGANVLLVDGGVTSGVGGVGSWNGTIDLNGCPGPVSGATANFTVIGTAAMVPAP